MLDFTGWSVWINASIFLASAAVVWMAGTRLVRYVDRFVRRRGMGQGFAGMLLLGGIVSLTEISTVSTAAFSGSPALAINNLLGSESINVFLLATVDPLSGREALTSFVAKPAMLLQGTMVIVLLAVAAIAMAIGDIPVFGVGVWSTALFLLCLGAMWLSSNYEHSTASVASDKVARSGEPDEAGGKDNDDDREGERTGAFNREARRSGGSDFRRRIPSVDGRGRDRRADRAWHEPGRFFSSGFRPPCRN